MGFRWGRDGVSRENIECRVLNVDYRTLEGKAADVSLPWRTPMAFCTLCSTFDIPQTTKLATKASTIDTTPMMQVDTVHVLIVSGTLSPR